MPADIRILMGMERAVLRRDFVVRIPAVPHTEAVMVLGRKKKIAYACFLRQIRPSFRIKADGIESPVQPEVLFLKFLSARFPVNSLS